MTEKGSDELFAELADLNAAMYPVMQDDQNRAEEEARVTAQALPVFDDEPGRQHADPDEAPPGDPPEFDPLPPD